MELSFFNEIGKHKIAQASGVDQDFSPRVSYFRYYY
jgi:hypothetical protein